MKSFATFLDNYEEVTVQEKSQIKESLKNNYFTMIVRIVVILLAWSIVMAFVDLFFISGLVIYIAMHDMGVNILIAPVAFLVINIICKFFVISVMAKNRLNYTILFVASLPYVGSVFLLGHTLQKNPLLRRVLLQYVSHHRKQFLRL